MKVQKSKHKSSLGKYLIRNNMTVSDMSYILKRPVATIYKWSSGQSKPNVISAVKIEEATNGEVSVYSW